MADTGVNGNFARTWVWMAALAVICIIGGFMALINPFGATIFAVTLAGWLFLLQGLIQVVHAFQVRDWSGFIWSLGLGILSLLVGFVLVADPLAGSVSLTLLVAVLFLMTGVAKTMFALSLKPASGWVWVLASGLVSVALGVMILAGLPATATTILGLLLGIELISNGVLFLFVALGLRKLGHG
ncbi:MAG: DUF308 domain-containing protein [Hoeflea sp.]|uniref:HdeD family acid-resistance protein n=1 Tax=Hoeflea sp. TaxID=1940281 RepID=UPI0032998975